MRELKPLPTDLTCGHEPPVARVFLPMDLMGYICCDCDAQAELYGKVYLRTTSGIWATY